MNKLVGTFFSSLLFYSVCLAQDKKDTITGRHFFMVDEMPQFPGGDKALKKFISCSSKYQAQKIPVQFLIDSTGIVKDVKTTHPGNFMSDSIAVGVIKKMPRWTPARQEGKNVEMLFNLKVEICE